MRLVAALSAAVVMLGAGFPALGQERLHVEGLPYSLAVPEGFAVAAGYPGYENAETKVTIRFAGFEEGLSEDPYAELKPVFDDAYLAMAIFGGHGIYYDRIDKFAAADGTELSAVHGRDPQREGTQNEQWVVLLGPEPAMMLVLYMPEAAMMTDDEVRSLVATLELKQD